MWPWLTHASLPWVNGKGKFINTATLTHFNLYLPIVPFAHTSSATCDSVRLPPTSPLAAIPSIRLIDISHQLRCIRLERCKPHFSACFCSYVRTKPSAAGAAGLFTPCSLGGVKFPPRVHGQLAQVLGVFLTGKRCQRGLWNCISALSSQDERMKYGRHYATPKNNNRFANTKSVLERAFHLFSRGHVRCGGFVVSRGRSQVISPAPADAASRSTAACLKCTGELQSLLLHQRLGPM